MLTPAYTPDEALLLRKNRLAPDSEEAADFLALLREFAPRIRPKAAITEAEALPGAEPDGVRIGGVAFGGASLLLPLFAGARAVWPYVATCGREGYDALASFADPLERFWAESILEDALDAATRALEEHFRAAVHAGPTSTVSPGSLPAWPLSEQVPLFRLLGGAAAACGVTLTESLLMLPTKSVSGIRFPDESGHVNCALCGRARCALRKAACILPASDQNTSGTPW